MRILALELEAFGPFRDRQAVDFESAAAGGILLISGRTGAGKSSLLDAVSFALYGAVPRYDGRVGRVRSDHAAPDQPTRVQLDFEMRGRRYRVVRSPEWQRPSKRKTKNGTGTTTEKQSAELWRWRDGDWHGVAAKPVDVAAELGAILGLSHAQFLQVVLLAQGGFQRFLHASEDDRRTTLRTLFQTQRFERVEALLDARRAALAAALAQTEARIQGLLEQAEAAADDESEALADEPAEQPDAHLQPATEGAGALTLDARRGLLAEAVARLASRADALRARAAAENDLLADADSAAQRMRALAASQRRRDEALDRRRRLDLRRPEVEALRSRLSTALRAARVEPEARRAERAAARRDACALQLDAALDALRDAERETLGAAGAGAARDAAARDREADLSAARVERLSRERDEAVARLASLDEARTAERELAAVEQGIARQRASLDALRAEHEGLVRRLAELPARRESLREQLAGLEAEAAPRHELRADVDRAEAAHAAAERAAELEPRAEAARRGSAERAASVSEAAERVRELLARRLRGMAGELAEQLAEAEPCPVCGSAEHPAPAGRDDPVAPEQIEAAEHAVAAASSAYERARRDERDLEAALVAERARCDGRPPAQTGDELERLRARLVAAEAAEERRSEHAAALQRLETEQASGAEHERSGAAEIATADAALAAAEQERARLGRRLDEARGGFPSLASRITATERLRDAIDTVLDRAREFATARTDAETAESERDRAVTEAGFESAAEALSAALPEPERARLADELAGFDAEEQRLAGVLADPELQSLPDEPVPLDEHEARLADARERARAAESRAAACEGRARERTAQLARLDAAIGESADETAALLRLRRLADTVQGREPNTRRMSLETFVLAARLETIAEAANERLRRMVDGRYRLQHDDGLRARGGRSGLGLSIMDEYTGRARSAASLSGGETFLVSLSLALGLADVVTSEAGGITLDTLFIDEGFGSLDPGALEHAMATLDGLREGGRTVALISHVAEMKERIPAQLEVRVDAHGTSRLHGHGVAEAPVERE